MNQPLTSILWLNYNSSSFIDIALESLQGVANLNYSNYELIVVDNSSTDESLSIIRHFIEKKMSAIKVKIIRLNKNIGFTGGNNVAYRARSPESKYVCFLNSDAIPYPNSLRELTGFLESDGSMGSVEGVCLHYDGKSIQGAGNFLSELLTTYSMNRMPSKPKAITYACGVFSVHRISSIQRAVGTDNSIFDEAMFAYYDDTILGLKMWNSKFKVTSLPIVTVRHKGSSSFGRIRPFQVYLETRSMIALNEISNSRYRKQIKPLIMYNAYSQLILQAHFLGRDSQKSMPELFAALQKGFHDGVKIGKEKQLLGEKINLYKAPIARVDLPVLIDLVPGMRLSGRVMSKLNKRVLQKLISNVSL
jgi:GT2 family glycosyltransferase